MSRRIVIIFCSGCTLPFRTSIANQLQQLQIQVTVLPTKLIRFSNQEIKIELSNNVCGSHVFVLQQFLCSPTSLENVGGAEISDLIMELFITMHTCKISFAAEVSCVVSDFEWAEYFRMHIMQQELKPIQCDGLSSEVGKVSAEFGSCERLDERFHSTNSDENYFRLVADLVVCSGCNSVVLIENSFCSKSTFSVPYHRVSIVQEVLHELQRMYPELEHWFIYRNNEKVKRMTMENEKVKAKRNGNLFVIENECDYKSLKLDKRTINVAVSFKSNGNLSGFDKVFIPDLVDIIEDNKILNVHIVKVSSKIAQLIKLHYDKSNQWNTLHNQTQIN